MNIANQKSVKLNRSMLACISYLASNARIMHARSAYAASSRLSSAEPPEACIYIKLTWNLQLNMWAGSEWWEDWRADGFWTGLVVWPIRGQITRFWLLFVSLGLEKKVWPFGYFLASSYFIVIFGKIFRF